MKLKEVAIILSPTFRSMAYLQKLTKNGMCPNFAIIMNSKDKKILGSIAKENKHHFFEKFDDFKPVLDMHGIYYDEVNAENCNDEKIIDIIKHRKERYFIYTGGGILKEEILSIGKKFIHVHPGLVPEYRGSTCIYYSIINDDKCGATAFFMAKDIDKGDIIARKTFRKPKISNIDYEYDSYIRSSLLVDVIQGYIKHGRFSSKPQNLDKGETYFIIHPVLKHLAILDCLKNEKRKNIP